MAKLYKIQTKSAQTKRRFVLVNKKWAEEKTFFQMIFSWKFSRFLFQFQLRTELPTLDCFTQTLLNYFFYFFRFENSNEKKAKNVKKKLKKEKNKKN